jgi:hypothetical protein
MPPGSKHVLNDLIGSTDDLERVLLEKIEAAEQFARTARALLKQIHGSDNAANQVKLSRLPQRFAGVDPYNATVVLLREQNRPLSKEEIVEELLAGNVMTASRKQTPKDKAENVKRSLKANVNSGKLKLLNERFGFPDWPDEMFMA